MAGGYDTLIVGAGSAGCVLASRLSEDASRRVLLLEAGPDYPADRLPPDIANGWEVAYAHDWGFVTEPDAAGRSINAWRGRLVGGCSALNATIALRGHPRDYDRWAELGNPGWSFADLLPFFRRLESDADFRTGWHGATFRGSPLRADELTPLSSGFLDAARAPATPTWSHNRPQR
jgi:choline dehydrogenase